MKYNFLLVAIALLFILVTFGDLGSIIGNIEIYEDTEKIKYQYAGNAPHPYQSERLARPELSTRKSCQFADIRLIEAGLIENKKSFPKSKQIGDYEFIVTDVKDIVREDNRNRCAGISYNVEVRKSGSTIDKIEIPSVVEECFDLKNIETEITRQYGNIEATFGWRQISYYDSTCGRFPFIINRYEIKETQEEENQEPIEEPIDENETVEELSIFQKINLWFQNLFDSLFGWLP